MPPPKQNYLIIIFTMWRCPGIQEDSSTLLPPRDWRFDNNASCSHHVFFKCMMSCTNTNNLTSSFPIWMSAVSFFYLAILARTSSTILQNFKKLLEGTRQMAQWVEFLLYYTCMAAHNHLQRQFQGIQHPLPASEGTVCTYMFHKHTSRQMFTHIKIKVNKSFQNALKE